MSNLTDGLKQRYTITHKDGQPIDPDKRFLVLDLSSPDPREFEAIRAFTEICILTGYVQLGKELGQLLFNGEQNHTWVMVEILSYDLGPFTPELAHQVAIEIRALGIWAKVRGSAK